MKLKTIKSPLPHLRAMEKFRRGRLCSSFFFLGLLLIMLMVFSKVKIKNNHNGENFVEKDFRWFRVCCEIIKQHFLIN